MFLLQPFHINLVFIYLSTVRLQVFFGLPLFPLPSGFQVNANIKWLLDSLLKLCPIYLQCLSRMVSLIGLVLVMRCSYSFEVFIGHVILMIVFKHTRWNLSSLSSSLLLRTIGQVVHCFGISGASSFDCMIRISTLFQGH